MPEKTRRPASLAENGNKKTLIVQQIASPIGKQKVQKQTLIGLGLNKVNRTRQLEDTASVRGLVRKVPHLVRIVSEE